MSGFVRGGGVQQRSGVTTSHRARPLLADRLADFGGRVCAVVRKAPRDPALDTIFRQLARSATSPAANYAEAREALSDRDYVHKLKIVVKELRESLVWLRMAHAAGVKPRELSALAQECHELIAISVTCIRKASGR